MDGDPAKPAADRIMLYCSSPLGEWLFLALVKKLRRDAPTAIDKQSVWRVFCVIAIARVSGPRLGTTSCIPPA